jgi:hypothetical protein
MAIKSIENIASSSLILAAMIDLGLLAYYFTLSSENIDALWNLPFIGTWLAAPIAFFSLCAYLLFVKPRSKPMVLVSAIAFLVPVSLEWLTRNFMFIR